MVSRLREAEIGLTESRLLQLKSRERRARSSLRRRFSSRRQRRLLRTQSEINLLQNRLAFLRSSKDKEISAAQRLELGKIESEQKRSSRQEVSRAIDKTSRRIEARSERLDKALVPFKKIQKKQEQQERLKAVSQRLTRVKTAAILNKSSLRSARIIETPAKRSSPLFIDSPQVITRQEPLTKEESLQLQAETGKTFKERGSATAQLGLRESSVFLFSEGRRLREKFITDPLREKGGGFGKGYAFVVEAVTSPFLDIPEGLVLTPKKTAPEAALFIAGGVAAGKVGGIAFKAFRGTKAAKRLGISAKPKGVILKEKALKSQFEGLVLDQKVKDKLLASIGKDVTVELKAKPIKNIKGIITKRAFKSKQIVKKRGKLAPVRKKSRILKDIENLDVFGDARLTITTKSKVSTLGKKPTIIEEGKTVSGIISSDQLQKLAGSRITISGTAKEKVSTAAKFTQEITGKIDPLPSKKPKGLAAFQDSQLKKSFSKKNQVLGANKKIQFSLTKGDIKTVSTSKPLISQLLKPINEKAVSVSSAKPFSIKQKQLFTLRSIATRGQREIRPTRRIQAIEKFDSLSALEQLQFFKKAKELGKPDISSQLGFFKITPVKVKKKGLSDITKFVLKREKARELKAQRAAAKKQLVEVGSGKQELILKPKVSRQKVNTKEVFLIEDVQLKPKGKSGFPAPNILKTTVPLSAFSAGARSTTGQQLKTASLSTFSQEKGLDSSVSLKSFGLSKIKTSAKLTSGSKLGSSFKLGSGLQPLLKTSATSKTSLSSQLTSLTTTKVKTSSKAVPKTSLKSLTKTGISSRSFAITRGGFTRGKSFFNVDLPELKKTKKKKKISRTGADFGIGFRLFRVATPRQVLGGRNGF